MNLQFRLKPPTGTNDLTSKYDWRIKPKFRLGLSIWLQLKRQNMKLGFIPIAVRLWYRGHLRLVLTTA